MTANPLSTIPPIGPTTGMTPPPTGGRFKPIDPVKLLRQHLGLLIIVGILGLFLGGGLWFAKLKLAPEYASEAQLLASGSLRNANSVVLDAVDAQQIKEIETFIQNQINWIISEPNLLRTVDRPNVRATKWFQQFDGDVRAAALALQEKHLRVGTSRGSTLIDLKVIMQDGRDATQILSELIDVYTTGLTSETSGKSALLSRVYRSEVDDADRKLNELVRQAANFLKEEQLSSLVAGRSDADITFQNLATQRVTLNMELQAAQAQAAMYTGTNDQGEPLDPNRPMGEMEEAYIRMIPAVMQREESIRQMQEELRTQQALGREDSHPYVRQVKERLASMEQQLDEQKTVELEKYRAQQAMAAVQAVEGLKSQMADLNSKIEQARLRMMDLTGKIQKYEQYQQQIQAARLAKENANELLIEQRKAANRPDITRISQFSPPTEAELVSPMWYVWIPGIAFLCVASTGGLLVLRELLDQRVKSPADVKMLPEATLLGVLPHTDEDPSGTTEIERIVERSPTGLMSESFRQVRTAVLSKMDRRGYKTLVVVSAQPESGTSSVVQNLATSLAYNGRNVLILDANFRRPQQHTFADISNGRGLVDILRDEAEDDDVIHRLPNRTLSVLPTGQASEAPPELLESPAFRALLGRLESTYDLIIIDAPPALLTSDSQLLAKHVDAIAVVVHASEDKRGMVQRMLGRLDGQRADVLGVILNGVKSAAGGYFRKSYADFYKYSTGEHNGSDHGDRNGSSRASRKSKAKAKADDADVEAEATETL